MTDPARGLYEVLVTAELTSELEALSSELRAVRAPLHQAEAADRISLHLGRVIDRALSSVKDGERVKLGVDLARRLLTLTAETLDLTAGLEPEHPADPGELLTSILGRRPDGSAETIEAPLTPLLDTTLLTNAPGEPRVGQQLKTEVASADRIDVVMAFIRRSGIRPLESALRRHCEAGRELRVLTTTYTQSTELEALVRLEELGARVRVSYDTTSTRLHAKAWVFHRDSGFSTAFIGSSNLTHSAQVSGLEWNVRASSARNAPLVQKVAAVFDSYWHGGDFLDLDALQFREATQRAKARGSVTTLSPLELRPEPFQERLLEQVAVARRQGHHRNLLVAATGTGKTVMAAVDYARLRASLPRARLLFVAHRKELLEQSLSTFRHAMRAPDFGELWVGGERPLVFDHVFASIQSLSANDLSHLAPDHFDVVVVDEFHHAAAPSYRRLLAHLRPVELLGLTATPERSDGLDILGHFDGRIAAELRLWDAIDQHRLTPFVYYGVHDGLDLRVVPWRRGAGYDVEGLTRVMTANDIWARQVVKSLLDHVDDVSQIRALGFCVGVAHARFMARVFQEQGIASVAVWGDSPASERRSALSDLRDGRVQVVFSVDLFNEGVDLPNVDTLLFLRPTESPTLFLQQLGRGLRRAYGKTSCTVLDFVGQHRKEFRFDRKLLALMGGTRRELEAQLERGFPCLPAGCHMELDRKASEIVLRSLKEAIPSRWPSKVEELRRLATLRREPSLSDYLNETGLELSDIYSGTRGWSDLCADAGLSPRSSGAEETALRRGVGRLLHVDDAERLNGYRTLLSESATGKTAPASKRDLRLKRMLVSQLGGQVFDKDTSLAEGLRRVRVRPEVTRDATQLFDVLGERIDHLHTPLRSHPDVPLAIHARYTRLEILAAFGDGKDAQHAKVAAWQTGVRYIKEAKTDLLAFTLDKSTGGFSPTTRYRDYALSRDLIHWESQGVTRAESETGLRYQHHAERGSHILLFARRSARDRSFFFLGPATYRQHRGEKPMALTWKLDVPLPGDLYAQFSAAVA